MPLSNTSPPSSSSTHPRNRHRKRISALRLSSDTTATLPAYIPVQSTPLDDSDRPPDYPDSAEEADSEDSANFNTYPSLSSPSLAARKSLSRRSSASKRVVSPQSHRRKKSWAHPLPQNEEDEDDNATDPYLDALLARSVHALEMSNTLLQSTMATQTSLSEAVAAADDFPPSPTPNTLSLRLTGAEDIPSMSAKKAGKRTQWADEIAALSRDVETLFEDPSTAAKPIPTSSKPPYTLVSSSLPTPSALSGRHRRVHPSLDLRHESHLNFSEHNRCHLVAPPPRAMTQYEASTSTTPYLPGISSEDSPRDDDDELVSLPSTLGLRGSSSVSHLPLTTPPPCSTAGSLQLSNNLRLHSALSSPRVTDMPHAPSTPAYNMLASFVARPCSQPPAAQSQMLSTSPFTSSFATFLTNSRSRSTSASSPRGGMRKRSHDTFAASRSEGTRTPERPSRSSTPKMTFSKSLPSAISATFQSRRPMTPPVEESSNSSSSSSEGEGIKAKLTVQSLRKILDEQPPLVNPSTMTVGKLKAPGFQPRTPARTPSTAGTSTTTASVSRLLTRNKHLVTAGGRPTHSPSPSLSTPGAGPSRLGPTEAELSSAILSTSPPRRGALKGSRANSQVNSPTPSVPPSPALVSPSASTAPAAAAGLASIGPIAPPSASLAAWTFLLKGGANSGSRTPSTVGSGRSTPKRISFAELPEAYNSGVDEEEDEEEEEDTQDKGKGKAKAKPRPKKSTTKAAPKRQPGESSEKFRQQREGRRSRRRREQRLKRSSTDGSSSDSNLKWWNWILGVPTNVQGKRYEDRIEERLTRGGLGAGIGGGGGGGMGGGFGGAGEWGV